MSDPGGFFDRVSGSGSDPAAPPPAPEWSLPEDSVAPDVPPAAPRASLFAPPPQRVGPDPADGLVVDEPVHDVAAGSVEAEPVRERVGGEFSVSDLSALVNDGNASAPRASRLPLVLAGVVAVALVAAGSVWWMGRDDGSDVDVAVAGSTTVSGSVPSAPETTAAEAAETTAGSTIVDEALTASYGAEVQRSCDIINADPGVATEAVVAWDAKWAPIGKSERSLRDDVNACALPARDRALAALGDGDAALQQRLASCVEPDVGATRANPDELRGACFVLVVRVDAREVGACQFDGVWDASAKGTGATFEGGPALFRAGNGRECPQISSLAAGSVATVWVTMRGATVGAQGEELPLFAVEQVR